LVAFGGATTAVSATLFPALAAVVLPTPTEQSPMAKHLAQNEPAPAFTKGSAPNLVDYQAGSVVSREILKKKTGGVTVFAFDENQGLSEHTAPFDALVQILDGVAEVTVGGTRHLLVKDEMLLMPANVPHAVKALGRFKMMLVMIREPAA
jgi:quercetin dioxygenase-like cupin family protein